MAKATLRKNKTRSTKLLGFKLYYKVILTKTVLYWHKNRHINHWNRTETPHQNPLKVSTKICAFYFIYLNNKKGRDLRNPHINGQLTYNRGVKNIQWERTVSSINVGETE